MGSCKGGSAFWRASATRSPVRVPKLALLLGLLLATPLPTEIAFWFHRTVATAYVVDNIEGWLRAGAPLPIPKKTTGQVGVSFGLEGGNIRLLTQNDIAEAVNERYPLLDAAHVGAYITDRPGARVLLPVADIPSGRPTGRTTAAVSPFGQHHGLVPDATEVPEEGNGPVASLEVAALQVLTLARLVVRQRVEARGSLGILFS